MEHELICTITVSRTSPTQVEVRLQSADGKWQATHVDRATSIGWYELRALWEAACTDVRGYMLPF